MRADYVSVEIYPSAGLSSLGICFENSEVTVLTKNWQIFAFTIHGAYAAIKLPDGFKWKKNTADFKEAFFERKQLANVEITAEQPIKLGNGYCIHHYVGRLGLLYGFQSWFFNHGFFDFSAGIY